MKWKSLVWIALLGLPSWLLAQTSGSVGADAASKEDVQKLFDVMASREQMHQMMQQLFAQTRALSREQIKKQRPNISEEELARTDRQSEELLKNFPLDEMLSDMIPVYQKHFSKSEIDSLTAFYSSAVGQKFLHEMPAVTAETMRTVYPRIQAELEAVIKRAEEKGDASQK